MQQSIHQSVVTELVAAHQIIRNALAVMTVEQKAEWDQRSEQRRDSPAWLRSIYGWLRNDAKERLQAG